MFRYSLKLYHIQCCQREVEVSVRVDRKMTIETETDQVKRGSNADNNIPDPEEDALDALKTVKKFILADLSESDLALIAKWPELDEYVVELCGESLEHLSREPVSLAAQEERLLTQLEDVSCGNYRALIEGFECAGAVRVGVSRVRSRLDCLVKILPELAASTREFSKNAAVAQQARERQLRTAGEAGRVLELLDMPRLMRTLLQSQLYEEALELREHAHKLEIVHSQQPLIQEVSRHIRTLTHQMISQLLISLRGPVELPTCLRIIGYLRRLDVYPEITLRMLFLHYRGEWMKTNIQQSRTNVTQQARLVSLSDYTRGMIFEIITQYKAIFHDEEEEYSEVSGNVANADVKSSTILYDWTCSCIIEYLIRLESGLRLINDGSSLNTVLQQAMSCGHSLGRVGADFRSALAPLFNSAVMRIYTCHLNASRIQFEAMLEDHRWAPVGSSIAKNQQDDRGHDHDTNETEGDTVEYNPPLAILDSPPLAVFLNGILAAFNDLRLCAPLSLGRKLGIKLEETIIEAAKFMSGIGGPGGVFLKRSDRPHFIAMITSLRDLCLPHAARCLDHCMNQSNLTRVDYVSEQLTEIFGDCVPQSFRTRTPISSPGVQANGSSISRNATPQNATQQFQIESDQDRQGVTSVVI